VIAQHWSCMSAELLGDHGIVPVGTHEYTLDFSRASNRFLAVLGQKARNPWETTSRIDCCQPPRARQLHAVRSWGCSRSCTTPTC
jgi:hypothetical protein